MTSFAEAETADRRLVVLRVLQSCADYTSNEFVLVESIGQFGHRVGADRLRTDLAWLEEQGLVIAQRPSGVWVVTLTARGDDVASGRAMVPGVKRPRPGV